MNNTQTNPANLLADNQLAEINRIAKAVSTFLRSCQPDIRLVDECSPCFRDGRTKIWTSTNCHRTQDIEDTCRVIARHHGFNVRFVDRKCNGMGYQIVLERHWK